MINKILFDSQKEGHRYLELLSLLKKGKIQNLQLQPRFILQEGFVYKKKKYREIEYISDFKYDKDGSTVIEDTKGFRTELYKLKKKLFLKKYVDEYTFIES